jgi:hypothetical protein
MDSPMHLKEHSTNLQTSLQLSIFVTDGFKVGYDLPRTKFVFLNLVDLTYIDVSKGLANRDDFNKLCRIFAKMFYISVHIYMDVII